MNIIRKVALAVFKDKKMLMARSAKHEFVFYTPGGKIEAGESEADALKREIQEELHAQIDEASLEFLHEFEAPAHGRIDTLVNIRLYKGTLLSKPKASGEVAEISYFDSTVDEKHLSEPGKLIFAWAKKRGYMG